MAPPDGRSGFTDVQLQDRPLSLTLVPEPITTDRLSLEPLHAEHAAEMVAVLKDDALYQFIGGEPPTLPELEERYRHMATGHPTGEEEWLNWIVRLRVDGSAIGAVQATVVGTEAFVAWTIGVPWQGKGYAAEAAVAMVGRLRDAEMKSIAANIHPEHVASQRIAERLGMAPTGEMHAGEDTWRGAL